MRDDGKDPWYGPFNNNGKTLHGAAAMSARMKRGGGPQQVIEKACVRASKQAVEETLRTLNNVGLEEIPESANDSGKEDKGATI